MLPSSWGRGEALWVMAPCLVQVLTWRWNVLAHFCFEFWFLRAGVGRKKKPTNLHTIHILFNETSLQALLGLWSVSHRRAAGWQILLEVNNRGDSHQNPITPTRAYKGVQKGPPVFQGSSPTLWSIIQVAIDWIVASDGGCQRLSVPSISARALPCKGWMIMGNTPIAIFIFLNIATAN